MGEASHVHDQGIVGAGRAVILCGPIRDGELCVIQEIRIASYDLLPGNGELAILSVVQGAVNRAARDSASCEKYPCVCQLLMLCQTV